MYRSHSRHLPRWIFGAFGALLTLAALAPPISAHPADEINERDIVAVRPDRIEIAMTLSAGSISYLTVWKDVDADGDRAVTAEEREAFGRRLGSQYTVTIDGVPTPVRYDANSLLMMPTLRDFTLASGDPAGATVLASFQVPCDCAVPHEITVSVHHYPRSSNGTPPRVIAEAAPPYIVIIQGGDDVDLRVAVTPNGPTASLPPLLPPAKANHAGVGAMLGTLRTPGGSPMYALFGLLIAAAFGALHALTPGHGKTLVTAYLVGGNARVRDAFVLGGIITLTHTCGVFAIGFVLLAVSQTWTPSQILPWIEVATSLVIIALGLALVRERCRLARSKRPHTRRSVSPPSHPIPHEHDDGTVHTHAWFGAHIHMHPAPGNQSRRALLLVGMSGGVLPCPDALAILLVAVAAGHLLMGMLIILSFSAGLALVLIGLGLLITGTGIIDRLASRIRGAAPMTRWIPAFSALMMVAAGAAALARAVVALR